MTEVKSPIPYDRNTTMGFISHPMVAWMSEAELEELPSTQQVTEVRKLPRCAGETLITSNNAVVTFLLPRLPARVTLG